MRTSFNKFKDKLEVMGEWDEEGRKFIDFTTPIDGDDRVIKLDGEMIEPIFTLDVTNNIVYIPNDDGALLPTDEFRHFSADEVHDFVIRKV